MDKILTYLLILAVTKDDRKAKMVMDMLYNQKPKTITTKINCEKKTINSKQTTPALNSKQQEIMDAISYIKSKPKKTKEDRDKIQMLEVILKSV